MSKRKELKQDIEEFWKIYSYGRQSWEIAKYIAYSNSESSKQQFWRHVQSISFRITIIELDKLFSIKSENQKFRLTHLINKLRPNGHYSTFKFSEETLTEWSEKIKMFSETFTKISAHRDTKYAHTDRNTIISEDSIFDRNEMNQIFDFAEEVIQKIYFECVNGIALTDLEINENKLNVFDKLEDYRKIKNIEIQNKLGLT